MMTQLHQSRSLLVRFQLLKTLVVKTLGGQDRGLGQTKTLPAGKSPRRIPAGRGILGTLGTGARLILDGGERGVSLDQGDRRDRGMSLAHSQLNKGPQEVLKTLEIVAQPLKT